MNLHLEYAVARRLTLLGLALATACADAPETDDDVGEPDSVEQAASLPAVSCLPASAGGDFYAWSGQLPANNGEVIKCQALKDYPADALIKGYRVLYRTTVQTRTGNLGVNRADVAVPASGIVWVPQGEIEPSAGVATRPVIANTHGAVGILARCGPSISTGYDRGYVDKVAAALPTKPVVVVPDYVGLGVDHKLRVAEKDFSVLWPDPKRPRSYPFSDISHPFVSLVGEGRATVDLVRAARQLPDTKLAGAPVKWLAFGQSQGGHGALGAAEVMAGGYADKTELPLLGVVVGAPATELSRNINWTPALKNSVQAMVAASLPLEWRDIRASRYLTDEGARVIGGTANSSCFNDASLFDVLITYNAITLFRPDRDPFKDTQASAALRSLDPGKTRTDVPIFVGQVRGDPLIQYQRTRDFVHTANADYRKQITHCEYYGGGSKNKDEQYLYELLDWSLRSSDHNAFGKMFADKGLISCTNYGGESPKTITTTPNAFVQALPWK